MVEEREEIILFSHYYNKLRYSLFTTLRPFTGSKFIYYSRKIGHTFRIIVEGKQAGKAKLLLALDYTPLNTHKDFIDFDTEGKWRIRIRKRYIFLLFKKEK